MRGKGIPEDVMEGLGLKNGADLLAGQVLLGKVIGQVLLGKVIENGIEPLEELIEGLILRGRVHNTYAPPGYGKTMLANWIAKRVIEDGGKVLYLDAENGVRIIAERLRDLGTDPALVDGNLVYLRSPSLPLTSEATAAYEQALDKVMPSLVVFDSWLTFLAGAGLDKNASTDVARWSVAYALPARSRGIAVLLLDHVPHEGSRARGSTRTKDEVDVQWRMLCTKPFDRERVGEIVLRREKDREGWLPMSAKFSVGGSPEGFVFEPSAGTVEQPAGDILTSSARKALEVLEARFRETGATWTEWHQTSGITAKSTLMEAIKGDAALVEEIGRLRDTLMDGLRRGYWRQHRTREERRKLYNRMGLRAEIDRNGEILVRFRADGVLRQDECCISEPHIHRRAG